jgi:hypothetical protein
MAISRFAASEKLTAMAMGLTYIMSPFSTLYDHVKDVDIGVSTWPLLPISSPTMPLHLQPRDMPSIPKDNFELLAFWSMRIANTRCSESLLAVGDNTSTIGCRFRSSSYGRIDYLHHIPSAIQDGSIVILPHSSPIGGQSTANKFQEFRGMVLNLWLIGIANTRCSKSLLAIGDNPSTI